MYCDVCTCVLFVFDISLCVCACNGMLSNINIYIVCLCVRIIGLCSPVVFLLCLKGGKTSTQSLECHQVMHSSCGFL